MEYLLVKGIVSGLQVVIGYQDLSPVANLREGAAVAGMIATLFESPASSNILASSRSSAESKMEYFKCFVNGKELCGSFYHVGFQEGEEVEFVVIKAGDTFEVHAARSKAQRLIWTLPHQMCGSIARRNGDLIGSLVLSIIFAMAFFVFGYFQSTGIYLDKWSMASQLSIMGFFIVFFVNVAARRHFLKYSYEANAIFSVFGMVEPKKVNLQKAHLKAELLYKKKHSLQQSTFVSCQYRY